MDRSVIYSQEALADLQEITTFIAADNPDSAIRFANRLVDLAETLRRLPERGRPVRKWKNVRVIILAPYLIFYRFETGSRQIDVLRFWHGARDPGTLQIPA